MPGFLPQAESVERWMVKMVLKKAFEGVCLHWRWARNYKQSHDAGKRAVQQVNSAEANFSVSSSAHHSHALNEKIPSTCDALACLRTFACAIPFS